MKYIKSYKIFENIQQAKSILSKLDIPETNKAFLDIKEMLKSNPGYIGWFTKMFFENKISMTDLKDLYSTISEHSEVIDGLSKPLISYTDWENLMDDIIMSKNNISIKRVINELPVLQRSFIDIKNEDEALLLLKLYKFPDKENIFKKISRYKTKKDLLNAINLFTTDERTVGYKNIKDSVVKSGARIVHDDYMDNLIICEVDFWQLKRLASDTSWCILNEHTFDDYADGIDKQYIIFLTDKTGNSSKIGLTYGLRFRTAHLINDSFISKESLTKILIDRGFDMTSLRRSKEDVMSSMTSDVGKLLSHGFTKEEILEYKQIFSKQDLTKFTKEEIEKHGLRELLEINENDLYGKEIDFDFIQNNKHRFTFKLPLHNIIDANPSPGQLDIIIDWGIVDKDTIEFANLLKNNRSKILEYMKKNNMPKYFEDIETMTYALKYCAVSSYSYDFEDVLNSIPKKAFKYSEEGFFQLFNFIKDNGFDYNMDDIVNLALKFDMRGYSHYSNASLDNWIKLCDKVPILVDKVREMLEVIIGANKVANSITGYDRESYSYLSNLGISANLTDLYESSMKIISKRFKDLKPQIDYKINLQKAWQNIKDVVPNVRYGEYGFGRNEVKNYMGKVKGRDHLLITPRELYDDFYETLKDEDWSSGSAHGTDMLPTLYMIFALVKLNKIEDIGKLKIRWSAEFTGKIIGQSLNTYTYNGTSYVHSSFLPTEKQKEKLFTYLLANIKDRITPDTSNLILDKEMLKHDVFSLVYYLYNWGFNNYVNLVKKTKNIYKEKWTKIDGQDHVERETIRADYFDHIFKYLATKKEVDKIKELIDMIMSWKMTPTELKLTERHFAYLGHDDVAKQIKDYIFGNYFPRENRKKYERNNNYW